MAKKVKYKCCSTERKRTNARTYTLSNKSSIYFTIYYYIYFAFTLKRMKIKSYTKYTHIHTKKNAETLSDGLSVISVFVSLSIKSTCRKERRLYIDSLHNSGLLFCVK